MMKFAKGLVLAVAIVGASVFGIGEVSAKSDDVAIESNVGNGKEYAYQITKIVGNEVHGKALNRISKTNHGIFLYKDEIGFDIKVGDKIVVVWGEEEDEFELIDKAVKLKNGEYVSKTRLEVEELIKKLKAKK